LFFQPVGYPVEEYSSKNELDFVGGIIKKEGIIVCRNNKILVWYRTYPSILLGALGARVDHAGNVMF